MPDRETQNDTRGGRGRTDRYQCRAVWTATALETNCEQCQVLLNGCIALLFYVRKLLELLLLTWPRQRTLMNTSKKLYANCKFNCTDIAARTSKLQSSCARP